jgi:HSP20 family protein
MSSESERTPQDKLNDITSILGSDGMFGGVSKIIQQLGALAEKGEHFKRAMEGDTDTDSPAKKMAGSFDYSVRFGTLKKDDSMKVSPESISPKASSNRSSVATAAKMTPQVEAREAEVELFEEEDHLLIVAEMPGVSADGVELTFTEQGVQIRGTGRISSFTKAIGLPRAFTNEDATITANNGIVEIRLRIQ